MFNSEVFQASVKALGSKDFTAEASIYNSIYFDPEESKIILFTDTQSSWPAAAHHKLWTSICRVPDNSTPESVVEVLLGCEALVTDLASAWIGSEWDGSNHVGVWDKPALEFASFKIEDYFHTHNFCVEWAVEYWLDGDAEYIYFLNKNGKSKDEIVELLHLGEAGSEDGFITKASALGFVEKVIENPENYGVGLCEEEQ